MNVKTLTAPTIHAALMEARRLLGDDVVLLESVPPQDGQLARITVMSDQPMPQQPAVQQQVQRQAPVRRTVAQPSRQLVAAGMEDDEAAPAFGYTPRPQAAAPRAERSARPNADGYALSPEARTMLSQRAGGDGHGRSAALAPRRENTERAVVGRGSFFPDQAPANSLPVPAAGPSLSDMEELLQTQLRVLHERLQLIERRFDTAIIGAAQQWTSHPLFGELLDQGMRPGTVTKLFQELAGKGYTPDAKEETLRWALAQAFRRSLNVSTPKEAVGAQLFLGPSGAGKTSLLLKLAKHPGFFGRRRTAVIVILPEDDEGAFHQSPVETLRKHGVAVATVRTLDEMQRAVRHAQHFDHLLIDTPPLPLNEAAARKLLVHIQRLVAPIVPLHVQLVVNATRALDDLDAEALQSLAIRPDAVALTHLDETRGWGRIAEWLMALDLPVQFASTSARVPDGVVAFSPTWFVEQMMKL